MKGSNLECEGVESRSDHQWFPGILAAILAVTYHRSAFWTAVSPSRMAEYTLPAAKRTFLRALEAADRLGSGGVGQVTHHPCGHVHSRQSKLVYSFFWAQDPLEDSSREKGPLNVQSERTRPKQVADEPKGGLGTMGLNSIWSTITPEQVKLASPQTRLGTWSGGTVRGNFLAQSLPKA